MKISPSTLSKDDVALITEILGRGNTCEVKKERENIVIVEIKRCAILKKPII